MSSLTFLLRRARRHWHLLVTLSLGVILTTVLLASAPILVETVVEFGLRRTLETAVSPLSSNVQLITFPSDVLDEAEYDAITNDFQSLIERHLAPFVAEDGVIPARKLRWLFPWVDEEILGQEAVFIRSYGELGNEDDGDKVTFVAGGWPEQVVVSESVIAGVIGQETADSYNLSVGDQLPLSVGRNESEARLLFANKRHCPTPESI